ncbi:hypothetical protein PC9H_001798 [Pleurotus ostreatus]|uniref:SMAD/FHA domain-containing protein n=2 Tax=Pleurotus ostreatus TaxID=5322 RepID=A0A8H7DMI3_PLEOS|nr:uncharacterized protein PC9H_001798 [Pleurotus ostreatus]KAF7419212.1 hypothetical protein PC9H_001798 [Pleurotus ostreatus]
MWLAMKFGPYQPAPNLWHSAKPPALIQTINLFLEDHKHQRAERRRRRKERRQARLQEPSPTMDPASPHIGTESPPLRTTILGSFLRGRPRNSSQSHINTDLARELSPSPPAQPPSPGGTGHRRRPAAGGVQASASHNSASSSAGIGTGLSHMLRRRRSAGNIATPTTPNSTALPPAVAHLLGQPGISNATPAAAPSASNSNAPAHRIRLVPHLDSRRSLKFEAIGRDIREGDPPLRIGRFTDRTGLGLAAVNALGSNKLAFKSKVVSRAHAEIWAEQGGVFFIRDTKSSSGTFLNHIRLSPANSESRPFQIKDGDILQLGVDYQGGTEDIYKSVKIRIELGREWQSAANAFNTNALKNLKSLASAVAGPKPGAKAVPKSSIPDCCICLFGVTIRQALFIAPCSHTFHYKCIRPLLETHHPAFSCPLCRTFADLDDDVEVEMDPAFEDDDSAVEDGPGPSTVNSPAVGPAETNGSRPGTAELVEDRDVVAVETDLDDGRVGITRNNRVRNSMGRLSDLHESSGGEEDVEMVNDANPHATAPGQIEVDDVLLVDAGVSDLAATRMNGGLETVVRSDGESDGRMSPAVGDDAGLMMQDDGEGSSDSNIGSKRKR